MTYDYPEFQNDDTTFTTDAHPLPTSMNNYANVTSLPYMINDLMLRISNYVPPKREELQL